ncbi:MAG: hypothetical protein FWG18_03980, partial [Alphaproteobacteria bacterium]|nr:hypothetical protein [Alphaproteobacteria bacterium]
MRETTTRILVGAVAALVGIGAFVLEDFNVPAMRWLVVIIMAGMIVELLLCFRKKMIRAKNNNMYYLLFGVCYLL